MGSWIYDRTEEDVINETPKGLVGYKDFNRIEGDVLELVNFLSSYGYTFDETMTIKTNWRRQMSLSASNTNNIPMFADMNRILSNINTLKVNFELYPDTPQLPKTMEDATYQTFNDIEKILYDLHLVIPTIVQYFRECNTFECGEED